MNRNVEDKLWADAITVVEREISFTVALRAVLMLLSEYKSVNKILMNAVNSQKSETTILKKGFCIK